MLLTLFAITYFVNAGQATEGMDTFSALILMNVMKLLIRVHLMLHAGTQLAHTYVPAKLALLEMEDTVYAKLVLLKMGESVLI